ncbi:Helix-turn-helix domain-containing protein [Nakamurella panacisegetis]|uniref:Helix-turn-helix domain-containing protein n=1 Tax=Nakamurella panacisegetis TaxID=1090615 RepID=A0A1H0P6S0_9ACTN|nr:helix-turn-helix domain-containing protein [Nakamurella panacisegetis]SDP00732.1 Helix-turn-helix domain-containing protein [Nakamurella panacisegetis]
MPQRSTPQAPDPTDPPTTPADDRPSVHLRDARSLRAFAHPLRVALISALRVHGPLTATQAAAIVDDSPSNCSFHLRTLASFGLIEEIPGSDGRQRLWRVVRGGVSFDPDPTAESRTAARLAAQVFHRHTLSGLYDWMDQQPDASPEWQEAWFDSNWTVSVTAAELSEISERIAAIIRPFVRRRRSRPDEPGESPVSLTAFAYPHRTPSQSPADPPEPV